MRAPLDDLEHRRPVWRAMATLYRHDAAACRALRADIIAASPYPERLLASILGREVHPVLAQVEAVSGPRVRVWSDARSHSGSPVESRIASPVDAGIESSVDVRIEARLRSPLGVLVPLGLLAIPSRLPSALEREWRATLLEVSSLRVRRRMRRAPADELADAMREARPAASRVFRRGAAGPLHWMVDGRDFVLRSHARSIAFTVAEDVVVRRRAVPQRAVAAVEAFASDDLVTHGVRLVAIDGATVPIARRTAWGAWFDRGYGAADVRVEMRWCRDLACDLASAIARRNPRVAARDAYTGERLA